MMANSMEMATSSNLMLVVKEIDGKGYGLFATNKMPKGTRILSEDIVGIFRVPSGLLSRINHACNNNARYHWNGNISRHTVHAIQDIEEGEEITINYLIHNLSQVERLEILLRRFNFTCSCKLCMSSPEDSLASDKRLFDINLLEELIQRGIRVGHAQCCLLQLRYLDSHNRLYKEEKSTTDGSPRSILAAAIICSTLGDLTRARVLALNAKVIFETAFGSDSIEVIETMDLARNPSMWRPKGYWSDWNTSTDAIPVGLTPEAFDDWLWRRPKPMLPQRSGQLADLRSRINFLGFADLPGLPKLHRAEFFDGDNNNANPKRHWVYLAEITYCDSNYRPGMLVMDMDNTQHPVYLNENSLWWATPGTIQKGYTIAVLYATRNESPADYHEADIVETDDRKVNIFPTSLQALLDLSQEMQRFSTEHDGIRICHGCSKKSLSLNKCSNCRYFWYCGKECQTIGWKEKGHKKQCKLLQDEDLRALFSMVWEYFHGQIAFGSANQNPRQI